jgi:hypothetical protein
VQTISANDWFFCCWGGSQSRWPIRWLEPVALVLLAPLVSAVSAAAAAAAAVAAATAAAAAAGESRCV